jgi:acyl-CoA thioester hydrolase
MQDASIPAPLDLHRETVRPDWIDYNGHMNVAYYVLAFDHATDVFFDFLGLGEPYRQQTGNSLFALEAHIVYKAELKQGETLRVTTQLLGHDEKRLHFFHAMYNAETGAFAAGLETVGLNVALATRKPAAFPSSTVARIRQVAQAHGNLPRPPEAGRVISLQRQRSSS